MSDTSRIMSAASCPVPIFYLLFFLEISKYRWAIHTKLNSPLLSLWYLIVNLHPGYPSSYTASSAGTCSYTIKKVSDDICQLRLDFQTFTGFLAPTTGACADKFAAAGQTGKNPPTICGANTGYHSKRKLKITYMQKFKFVIFTYI